MLAVSTDFMPTLAHWAKELNATYPLLSDHDGSVGQKYGVFIAQMRLDNRATFVIDPQGKIIEIVEGNAAIDPAGAETACTRIKKH